MVMITQRIAIIGVGFSGLAVFAHIVDAATKPLHIQLFERADHMSQGTAFGTASPCHLLNVRAGQMGALYERPDHFFAWLLHNEAYWRAQTPEYSTLNVTPYSFLPRHLYGLYLADLLKKTLEKAKVKNIYVDVIQQEVVDAIMPPNGSWVLQALDGSQHISDFLILSTGIAPTKRFPFETLDLIPSKGYFHNIWNEAFYKNSFAYDSVVIIGSGLTAVDALSSLYAAKYKGKITVLSKHGHFPLAHLTNPPALLKDFSIDSLPKDGTVLLDEIRNLLACGIDWQQLMDTLRPYTTTLWQNSSDKAKKQFMRHLYSLWNKHRHRMAPESAQMIQHLQSNGQLELLAETVRNVEYVNGSYKVTGSSGRLLEGACVLNCTGPSYDVVARTNPLLTHMLEEQFIEPDSLKMGLKVENDQLLAGNNNGTVFGIGPLLFGTYFETTAVPEIRQQANVIAGYFNQILA